MRLTLTKTLTVACIGLLSVGAYHIQKEQEPATGCAMEVQGEKQAICLNANNSPTWYDWFTGESRSAQFHYLDLLELLSRGDEQKASGFNQNGY